MKALSTQVDVVYLWVNSNDKQWQKKRRESFKSFSKTNKENLALYANVDGRFRDNGELLFNLRCLEKFFPDHGQIYVITDDQRPDWMVTNNSVKIVDHQDIIPKKNIPIFSSSNIESYIHHIPNLSEKFIYLNDDVFFGAPVNIDWWFKDKLKYFCSKNSHKIFKEMQPNELSPLNGSILSKKWLERKYYNYKHLNKIMTHSPKPFTKSLLFKIEEVAEDLFSKTRSKNFRTWDTPGIISNFAPRWLSYQNFAKIIEIEELYIESGSIDIELKLNFLTQEFGKIPFFCINDTCDNAKANDKRLLLVKEKLEQLLPKKSSFEI